MIISQDGVKRRLEGAFGLCIDVDELDALARHLRFLHAGMVATGSTYGWLTVDTSHPDKSPPNHAPRNWSET